MKKVFLILGLILSSISVFAKEIADFELQFRSRDFEISMTEDGVVSIAPKLLDYCYDTSCSLSGLPKRNVNVCLPQNSLNIECEVVYKDRLLLESGVTIASAPQEKPISCNAGDSYEAHYEEGSTTQGLNIIEFVASNRHADGTIAYFLICPFEFEAATGSLYLITNLVFNVSYDRSAEEAISTNYNPELREAVRNVSNLFIPSVSGVTPDGLFYEDEFDVKLPESGIDYAIITSSSLAPYFAPLAAWKRMKGVRTEIITLEDIFSRHAGDTNQEKIKREIEALSKSRGLKYVLLGGDDTVVPVRLCKASCSGYTDYIPSDMYYVCFNGNFKWDGNNNGIYGEVDDSIDFSSTVFISRLPVRISADITGYLRRLLIYEARPDKVGFKNNLLMCGTALFEKTANGEQSDASIKGEILYSDYIKPYWSGKRKRFYDTITDMDGGASYDLTYANLQSELSKGYSFMDIMTHGSADSWQMERGNSYSTAQAEIQNNSYGYTHITTMACHTNAFDSQTDPCLSESFIRNTNSGVLSYFGSSRYGWGSSNPNSLGSSLQYEAHYYKNLFNPDVKYKNFAKLVYTAKSARQSACKLDGSARWLQFSLNAIGDPEMPIYVNDLYEIEYLDVSYDKGFLMVGTGSLYCDIAVSSIKDNGDSYYSVVKNTRGADFLDINCDVIICITAPGYAPVFKYLIFKDGKGSVLNQYPTSKIGNNPIIGLLTSGLVLDREKEVSMDVVSGEGCIRAHLVSDKADESSSSSVFVSDVVGNVLFSERVLQSEDDEVAIYGLSGGIYIVNLVVDGVVIESDRVAVK